MTFLNSGRENLKEALDLANKPSRTKKRRKFTKAADTEAEIARYFVSANPTSLDVTTSNRQPYQQNRGQSRDHESPQAFVDLPERPFLGFGGCGPNASISPAKSLVNKHSRSLVRGTSGSPTASTSYLTWSESRGPSYASPRTDKGHRVEPLKTSTLSNRNYTPLAPHKAQHSIPPVTSPCVPSTSLRTQSAAPRPPSPSSKRESATKTRGQNSQSPLVIAEQLSPRDKIQSRGATGNVKLDAAKTPKDIDGSIPQITDMNEAAPLDCPKSAPATLNQAVSQSSGHESRRKPPAHDLRPVLQTNSPHRDQLDDILEGLLRDCNTNFGRSDTASRTKLSHPDPHFSEEIRIPADVQKDSCIPAHAFVDSSYSSGPTASPPDLSKKTCSSEYHLGTAIDGSMPTHSLYRKNLDVPSRPSMSYPQGYLANSVHSQMNSMNAWNGYDTFYGKQQETADTMQVNSIGRILPNEAVQYDPIGPSGESDHNFGPCEEVPGCHPAEVREGSDEYRSYSSELLQQGSDCDNYQKVKRGEWYDQHVNDQASNEPYTSLLDMSYERFNDGIMALNHAKEYQKKEQSFAQKADEPETEDQRFTTNVSDTYHSWRPLQLVSSKYGLEVHSKNGGVRDVDSALSEFWTPHKLY